MVQAEPLFCLAPFNSKALYCSQKWPLKGGQRWPSISISLADFNIWVFSIQTGSTTCQVHLLTGSCPSCILLMALSPINKACSWLLDAACLPGTVFHPTLALQYAWGFWHAYGASPRWITNGQAFVKHRVATFPPPLTWAPQLTWVESWHPHK